MNVNPVEQFPTAVLWKDLMSPEGIVAMSKTLGPGTVFFLNAEPRDYEEFRALGIDVRPRSQVSTSLVTVERPGQTQITATTSAASAVMGKSWSLICDAGVRTFVVENGKVWSSVCKQRKLMGVPDKFEISDYPTRCMRNACDYHFDALAPKHGSENLELPNFRKFEVPTELASTVEDVRVALLTKLQREEAGYATGVNRQRYPNTPFKTTRSVLLRKHCNIRAYNWQANLQGSYEDVECADDPTWMTPYSEAGVFARELLPKIVGVEWQDIGQIILSKLPAGEVITTHWDAGYYFEFYNRYHFVLDTNDDCDFMIRDETTNMKVGSIYRINNIVRHSVANRGTTDRYHVVVDARYRR